MPVIKSWINSTSHKLSKAGINSSQLDAELILAHCLGKPRTYLHAHCDDRIDDEMLLRAERLVEMRLERQPIAYLLGYRYFYGRKFEVTTDTLIPRPESEDVINIIKESLLTTPTQSKPLELVDMGTGSGCLGITLKLEVKNIDVTLIDISSAALKIADTNASNLGANVKLIRSDLFSEYNKKADIIVANLPYVDQDWNISPETRFEPPSALFANNKGLEIITKMIEESPNYLNPDGYMVIEADPVQHKHLIDLSKKHGFEFIEKCSYVLLLRLTRQHQC